jgi:regulator of PEP synthase PpsR (kinase-PPPase family)
MAESSDEPLTIVILSGATGRTAENVLNTALAQFDKPNVRIVKQANVRTSRDARRIVRQAAETGAVVCHSLVSATIRDAVVDEAKHRLVPAVDVLGGTLALLSDHLRVSPRGKPGLAYKLQKDYFDRMEAVSFTLEHDDGCGLSTLRNADVVLAGVSRSSKSVTCFYLAYRGIRAANVPLIEGFEPPEQLVKMPARKVIGLTLSPARLHAVREARRQLWGEPEMDGYVGQDAIRRELTYALSLMKRHGWSSIDVSYMAVEEVARRICGMIGK